MSKIFVDTSAWVALKDKSDKHNQKAIELNKELLLNKNRYFTSNYIIDETLTLILMKLNHNTAIEFGEEIRNSKLIEIIYLDKELEEDSWQFFKKYSDKNFSFTDCSSFIIMKKFGIQKAFSSDHHFEQAGFIKLL